MEILRFLTFRLDFNDFHAQQRAHGASVGLTNTPPPHLKFSRLHDYNNTTDGDRMVPTRSDSPTFERNGPEAWTVGETGNKEGRMPKALGRSAR